MHSKKFKVYSVFKLIHNDISKASETLMTESGCKLEHSITSSLREQVMGGLWKNVMDTLAGMEELVKHKRCVQVNSSTIIQLEVDHPQLVILINSLYVVEMF